METKPTGLLRAKGRLITGLLIGMTVVSTMAWAGPQPLNPGQTITPSTYTGPSGANPAPKTVYNPTGGGGFSFTYEGGTVLDTLSGTFSNAKNVTGSSWEETVVKDSNTGDLDFYIQITIGTIPAGDTLGQALFSELAPDDFKYTASVGLDVTSTEPPGNDGTAYPQDISFNSLGTSIDFSSFVDNNGTSFYLGVFTDAPYAALGSLDLSGGNGNNAFSEGTNQILVPAPEPMTILFGFAILGVIAVPFIPKMGFARLLLAGKTLAA